MIAAVVHELELPGAFVARPATDDDSAATFQITRDALHPHAEAVWGPLDDAEQRALHSDWYLPGRTVIVEHGTETVGFLAIDDRSDMLFIDRVALAPAWHGLGIGTRLTTAVMRTAAAAGKAVGLSVLDDNPVRALYTRLGFSVDEVVPPRTRMVWPYELAVDYDAGGATDTRVRLRRAAPTDIANVTSIMQEATVAEWWGDYGPERVATEFVHDVEGQAFLIEVNGVVAGLVQHYEELDPQYRSAGIDIAIADAFQGKGIGPAAVRAVMDYLVERRGHHRLIIDPAASNERAVRAYEKAGFQRVGVMRMYERRSVDEPWHDGMLMDFIAGPTASRPPAALASKPEV